MRELSLPLLQKKIAFERDQACYREIFLLFHKPLLRFAKSFVESHEASEEIVSDVMVNVWEMKEELANVTNLKVYLYTAVRNRAFNYLTRTKKHFSWDGTNQDIALAGTICFDTPEKTLENKEVKEEIVSAVKALPPKCRMVYKLVRENGLSYKEVGTIMNISVNTVDRHLNTALHKIVHAVKLHFC